jgi:hypothetical protein
MTSRLTERRAKVAAVTTSETVPRVTSKRSSTRPVAPIAVVPTVFPRPVTALPTPETTGGTMATAAPAVSPTAPTTWAAPDATFRTPDTPGVTTAATAPPTPEATPPTTPPTPPTTLFNPARRFPGPEEGLALVMLERADLPVPRPRLRSTPTARAALALAIGLNDVDGRLDLTETAASEVLIDVDGRPSLIAADASMEIRALTDTEGMRIEALAPKDSKLAWLDRS